MLLFLVVNAVIATCQWAPVGGGGTPLYQVYSARRVWVLSRFGLKTGIDFEQFVWNWVWLSGELSRKLITLFFFPASNWWERKRNRSNRSLQLNFTYSSLLRWIPFSTDADVKCFYNFIYFVSIVYLQILFQASRWPVFPSQTCVQSWRMRKRLLHLQATITH